MKQQILIFCAVLGMFFFSCKKNEPINPSLPHTKIFLDKINLNGNLRLGTNITIYWTGYSSSGYIKGFEISFDKLSWHYTKNTDSTFLFSLPNGNDSTDISLYVRAIDNYGQKDPDPAKLIIPVKNSPPKASFDRAKALADTVWTIFSVDWTVHDPDGDSTIDSVFIKINNGNWYALNPLVNFLTFYPVNVTGSGAMNASLYKNLTPVLLNNQINGLVLNGQNKLYIRAKDNGGAYSPIDSTAPFYVKGKTSDLLLINANSSIDSKSDPLRAIVGTVYGKYDYINYIENGQKYQPQYWDPTLDFLLGLYNKVFIYTDGLMTNGKLVLEYASNALSQYLNKGGKLMVSIPLPVNMDPNSSIYNFSPADSVSSSSGQARFYQDSLAIPDPVNAAGYQSLENSTFILGFEPIYTKPDAKVMYTGEISKIYNWKGPDVICAKTINTNGKTNQIFWAIDVSLLNGKPAALNDFFNKAFLNEFNW